MKYRYTHLKQIKEGMYEIKLTATEAYCSVYGSWKPLKECRPAAARIEFCGGLVQGSPAASTVINPVAIEFVVLSCPR